MEPILKQLHPQMITDEEKAFGITHKTKTIGILLRNWLTYLLRECILDAERAAYHTPKLGDLAYIKRKLNMAVKSEIRMKAFRYKNEGKVDFFDKIFTHADILCKKNEDGEYEIKKVFPDFTVLNGM